MGGVRKATAITLACVCAASLLVHADAQARSLFQAVTNSSNTTTLLFAATSSAFMPTTSAGKVMTTMESPAEVTTGVISSSEVAPLTSSIPLTTPSMTFGVNVTIPAVTVPMGTNVSLPGVAGLVTVLESITFPVPKPTEDYEMKFPDDSAYAGVGASIPKGAWPAGDRRQPSMTVFSFQEPPELAPGTAVAGEMVNFGPDGIVFNSPVEISVPLGGTAAGFLYSVRKYNESLSPPWINKMGSKAPIVGGAGTGSLITGETDSFSPYGAIQEPQPAAPETTPVPDEGGGSSCNGGCVAGAVIGTLAGVALIGGGGYYAYQRKDEWMSRRSGEDDDEPPIQRQDARRGEDDVNEREDV